MVLGIGILFGIFFALVGLKLGFYEMLTMFFNVLMSVYLGIFLGPVLAASGIEDRLHYANSICMLIVGVATFLVLFVISYFLFTSQFKIPFPKIFDMGVSGILGFLTGFLVWSFLSMLVLVIPISQGSTLARIGFSKKAQQTNLSYVYRCSDIISGFVSNDEQSTEKVIESLPEFQKKRPVKSREPAPKS
ncbi:MAG: CvpA family protein [Planctomycetes bacterium]|nr:CvpA family protein [Planctomycetota bacterium]